MFEDLNSEKDFDALKHKIMTTEKTFSLGTLNTRVLLSSFLFKNFGSAYLLNENDDLFRAAAGIADRLVAEDFGAVADRYDAYYEHFSEWRRRDIALMQSEILGARRRLVDMKVGGGGPSDDAERQWDAGLDLNLYTMDTCVSLLRKYEKMQASHMKP